MISKRIVLIISIALLLTVLVNSNTTEETSSPLKAPAEKPAPKREVVPEYLRHASEIIFFYDNFSERFLFDEFVEIVHALPDYTSTKIVSSEPLLPALKKLIKLCNLKNTKTLITKESYVGWGRDVFETVRNREKTEILVPLYTKISSVDEAFAVSRFLKILENETMIVAQTDVVFEGGNIFLDIFAGQELLFTGNNNIFNTQDFYRQWHKKKLSVEKVKKLFANSFGVDRVIILGRKGKDGQPLRQSELLYHIDLAVTFTGEGRAVVTHVPLLPNYRQLIISDTAKILADFGDSKLEKEHGRLSELRIRMFEEAMADLYATERTLKELGYKVSHATSDMRHLFSFQSYANIVPYCDRITGKKVALVPIFPYAKSAAIDKNTFLEEGTITYLKWHDGEYRYFKDEFELTGLNKANLEKYRAVFDVVIPIEDNGFYACANPHCFISVMK